jgi:hypothetical protein
VWHCDRCYQSYSNIALKIAAADYCLLSAPAQLIRMVETEIVDEVGATLMPDFLVIGSFGRKEKDSQYLGHVPDVTLKNSSSECLLAAVCAQPDRQTDSEKRISQAKSRKRARARGGGDIFDIRHSSKPASQSAQLLLQPAACQNDCTDAHRRCVCAVCVLFFFFVCVCTQSTSAS